MSRGDARRLWWIRLAQLSPLIVFAIAGGLWLFLGPTLRGIAVVVAGPKTRTELVDANRSAELFAVEILDSSVQMQTGRVDVNPTDAPTALQLVADATGSMVGAAEASSTGVAPLPETTWDPVTSYESSTGARVAVIELRPAPNPPVALWAIPKHAGLTAAERREFEASHTAEIVRHDVRGGTGVLPVDVLQTGSTSDVPLRDGRTVRYAAYNVGGRVYETYAFYPASVPSADMDALPVLTDLTAIDSPQNVRSLRLVARLTGDAVLVVGPTERSVLLRAPSGVTTDAAAAALLGDARRPLQLTAEEIRPTRLVFPDLARLGGWTGARICNLTGSFPWLNPKAPVVLVAFWRDHPAIPLIWSRLGRTPVRVAQVWMVSNSPFLLGLLGACFLASLIAAPAAFAYERRITAEEQLEQARERVREEARTRVVDRLTELSATIDRAALAELGATPGTFAEAAREIEVTVNDLKAILGQSSTSGGGGDV